MPKGTENYYPPEIRIAKELSIKGILPESLGFSYQGTKADMFSLGVLLFVMYFGGYPFSNMEITNDLFSQITSGDLTKAEIFFNSHPLTKGANKRGQISR